MKKQSTFEDTLHIITDLRVAEHRIRNECGLPPSDLTPKERLALSILHLKQSQDAFIKAVNETAGITEYEAKIVAEKMKEMARKKGESK